MTDAVTATDPGGGYVETASAAVGDLLRLRPETATVLGDHRYDDALDDLSESGIATLRTALAGHRDALDSLDLDQLEVQDGVDADILRTGLDRMLLDLDVTQPHRRDPLAWLPGDALFPLLARDTLPAADRLRSLAGRLAQVPDRLALARRAVERPSRVHVETAVEQTGGALGLVRDEVSRLLAEEPGLRPLVEPAQAAAARALEQHRDALADGIATADGDPRLGPDLFAARLHLVLDSDLPAPAVVARAREHLAAIEAELAELCGGPERVRAALDEVGREAPTDATIVPLARRALEDATAAVRRLGLVTVPDDPTEVVVMPEHRRGVAVAYCDPPGPLENGGVTFFAVSPPPDAWSPERVESFYREYNSAMVVNLTVHEAMPGHVLQLAHMRRFAGSTPVRQVFWSGSFAEGWAVHAERLMADAGHGGRAVKLQQLKMQLRMTINALLDAGVHAEGMTEAEAMRLMTGRGHQEEGEALGKSGGGHCCRPASCRPTSWGTPNSPRRSPAPRRTTRCSRTARRRRDTCRACSPRTARVESGAAGRAVRMRRSLLGALLLVAALAACGSAAPKDNGEAAKKGPEVLADAKAALRTAGTFRVSGSVMQQGQSLVVDLLVKAGQGSRGTVTVAGQKVDLVTTGGIGYLRAPAGFYTAQGAPAATAQLAGGKYVKIPAGQAKELDAFSNIDTLLATSGAVQPAVAPADVGGAKAVVVSDAQGRLLVAATGPALPLRLESTKGSGVATFSQFGTPVDLTPPPGSIDAAALTGGK